VQKKIATASRECGHLTLTATPIRAPSFHHLGARDLSIMNNGATQQAAIETEVMVSIQIKLKRRLVEVIVATGFFIHNRVKRHWRNCGDDQKNLS